MLKESCGPGLSKKTTVRMSIREQARSQDFDRDVPIERGRAMSTNFDDYRLIRNREAPATIEVIVLPSTLRPTGMGEIGIPPIAPAVANAIAALTGTRIREMPFIRAGFDLTASRP